MATIIHGDARQLPLDDASVDAIVCDPPYDLLTGTGRGFMGKTWDGTGVAFDSATWREALRVLKPGAFLAAFGGTRTFHRLTCAIEDAGFEIRDSIGHAHTVPVMAWVHGQGFPKGSSQLKPAWEPIVVARKPLAGTVAANVLAYGTGGINIDATRVAHTDDLSRYERSATSGYKTGGIYGDGEPRLLPSNHAVGRWPTNVVLTHQPLVDDDGEAIGDACEAGCVDGCPVAELDAQSGTLKSGANPTRRSSDEFRDAYGDFKGQTECTPARGVDSGGASRFFPTFRYQAKAPTKERPKVNGVAHNTVKPLTLIRWMVRLVTPPGGTVLDPFAGSGTTIEAALLEGFDAIGVEYSAEYLPLIQHRVDRAAAALAACEPVESAPTLFDVA